VSLIDLVWLLVWTLVTAVGATVGWWHWGALGGLGGGLSAAVLWLGVNQIVARLFFRTPVDLLPPCRSTQSGRHAYRSAGRSKGEYAITCDCGASYVFVPGRRREPTRFMVLDGDRRARFMRLENRKWMPDAD
jgi:hypothetical protein